MKFKATEDQVKKLMAVAVNASKPVGMGFLAYSHKLFKPDDFDIEDTCLDYFQGRMVKLYINRESNGEWSLPDHGPKADYQSWAAMLPTYRELLAAAGLEFEKGQSERQNQ